MERGEDRESLAPQICTQESTVLPQVAEAGEKPRNVDPGSAEGAHPGLSCES